MRVRMKLYVGRLLKGIPLVYVIGLDGDSRLLPHRGAYGRVHEWGTRGAGSLQLSYDILIDATGNDKIAFSIHRAFQRRFITQLALGREWKMTEAAVHKAAVTLKAEQIIK